MSENLNRVYDINDPSLCIAICLALLVVIFIIKYTVSAIREKKQLIVRTTSKRYLALERLNKGFAFKQLADRQFPVISFKTKQKFDTFVFSDYIVQSILNEFDYYEKYLKEIEFNRDLLRKYSVELEKLPHFTEENAFLANEIKGIRYFQYRNYEEELVDEILLQPKADAKISYTAVYSSPKGRNSYSKSESFQYADILELYETAIRHRRYQQTREYQRSLMTPKLRSEIMRRDGFRCVLCGRTAKEDGVKLEVDHIFPVSKGGKTEPNNLRTLCMDCNRGKGSSYFRDAPN